MGFLIDHIAYCNICGAAIDTREESEGGDPYGSEYAMGEWVCSHECFVDMVDRQIADTAAKRAAVLKGEGRKILFLDIDGVLNKESDYEVHIERSRSGLRVNRRLVERLQQILKDTGAKVVLSSSWRNIQGAREFLEKMGISIRDETDNGPGCRGDQIQRWLDAHPDVETYAIVDDDSDMLNTQLPHFVLTEFVTGLTEQAAYRLTYKLGGDIPFGVSR